MQNASNTRSPLNRNSDYTGDRQRKRYSDYNTTRPEDSARGSQLSPASPYTTDGPGGIDLTSPSRGDLNMRAIAHDLEVKQATESLDEMAAIAKVVKQIEGGHASVKDNLNDYDLTTSDSGITIQTLTMSYAILKSIYVEGHPQTAHSFDQQIDKQLRDLLGRCRVTNQHYNEFKGEFYSIHDSVINKDMGILKLNRVQRTLEKQEPLLQKLPALEKDIVAQADEAQKMKELFLEFEKGVFNKKFDETTNVLAQIVELVKKIQEQQARLSQAVAATKEATSSVKALTKEQRLTQQKILTECVSIRNKIDSSKEKLAREVIDKNIIEENHEESNVIRSELLEDPKLTKMAAQSKKYQQLVNNNNKASELLQRLQELGDAELDDLEYNLQKQQQELKKFADAVEGDLQNELEDLLRKVQKLDKKINGELDEVEERLNNFEGKVSDPKLADTIPDSDLIFVKKEINRNRSAAQVARGITNDNVADAQDIKQDIDEKQDGVITPEDVQALKQIAKALQREDEVDLPRLRKNLDNLEGFSLKALKNQMHEDNKKSQQQISEIKKTFEDLQKIIDRLNGKIASASSEINHLREAYTNEDLERENEIMRELIEKLEHCDDEVNADNETLDSAADSTIEQNNEFNSSLMATGARQPGSNILPSLQMRKKAIIKDINENVQLFNENNKAVREANKAQKTEREVAELIARNKEIQKQATRIEDKIGQAKDYAVQIEKRIDGLTEPLISQLREKYTHKNKTIDACDDLFDKCQKAIDDNSKKVEGALKEVNDVIDKLEAVSPLAHPSSFNSVGNQKKQAFMKKIQEKMDKAHQLRAKAEDIKNQLMRASDDLNFIVEPLNQIGEREVKQPEIDQVLAKEKELHKELQALSAELDPLVPAISKLNKEVDDTIDDDKNAQILLGQDRVNDLEKLIAELEDRRQKVHDKLDEYNDLLNDAEQNQGKDNPDFAEKIRNLKKEALGYEKELKDLDGKLNDLKRKRNDMKKTLDDVKADPSKYTPAQLETLINGFEDQVDKAETLNDRYDDLYVRIDGRLKDVRDLAATADDIAKLKKLAEDYRKQIKNNYNDIADHIDDLPNVVNILRGTLGEMKKASEPKGADYFDERQAIRSDLDTLDDVDKGIAQIQKELEKATQKQATLDQNIKKNMNDLAGLKVEVNKMGGLAQEMEKLKTEFDQERVRVDDVIKRMDDCMIPVNVQRRRVELEAFSESFRTTQIEINDMLQADEAYDGEQSDEHHIAQLIREIKPEVEKLKKEEAEAYSDLQSTLESWPLPDCHVIEKQQGMVEEVSKFRDRIAALRDRLEKLKEKANTLNTALVQQNMDNALGLFEKRANKLRQRALAVQAVFGKIKKAGEDMDGNHTDDEIDFVEALQEEMPTVEDEMKNTLSKIDYVDQLVDRLRRDRDVDTMGILKTEIDQATRNVEEKENLAAKLEPEIVQWDPLNKLVRRDDELEFVGKHVNQINKDLNEEFKFVERESQRLEERAKQADAIERKQIAETQGQVIGMIEDLNEVSTIKDKLLADYEDENKRFNVVKPVKVNEAKDVKNGKSKQKVEDPTMDEIYGYVTINGAHRPDIKKLCARAEDLIKSVEGYQERNKALKEKLGQKPKPKVELVKHDDYIPDKKDPVDVMFAAALKRSNYRGQIKVVRIKAGQYMFGTKKILAKIINGKLVIRVGGGYMNVDEFIEQYGKMEVIKAFAEEEKKQGHTFKDEAYYEHDEDHAGYKGKHTHKAKLPTTAGGKRGSIQDAMKAAELYVEGEKVKHNIENALFSKFAGLNANAAQERSNQLNLALAKLKTGDETGVSAVSPSNKRASSKNNVASAASIRAGIAKGVQGSPRLGGSPKKKGAANNGNLSGRGGVTSPKGTSRGGPATGRRGSPN